jgi:AraC-like DNA-binding protein
MESFAVLGVRLISLRSIDLPAKTEKPGPLRFATDDYAPKDCVAIWREMVGRRLDFVPFGDGPVRATAEVHALGPADLYLGETSPGAVIRTKDLTRDGNGDFRFMHAGTNFQCIANGITQDVVPSEAALAFNGMPSTIFYPERADIKGFKIKREALAALVNGFEERPVIRLVNSVPLNLLKGYINLLSQDEPVRSPAFAHKVGQHLVELVALALNPARDMEAEIAGTVREVRLASVQAHILSHLGEVRLSAQTVARRHGISTRHIHRLFEQTGKTFAEFVLEERLKRVYQLLIDPACAAKRISDIAAEGGFGDISTFNRTFRRRFGDTPRAIRQGKA